MELLLVITPLLLSILQNLGTHIFNDRWAAMGFGTGMVGANIILGYKDGDGNIQLGQYEPIIRSRPPATNFTTIELVNLEGIAPDWATLSYSFRMPAVPAGNISYVWATDDVTGITATSFKKHNYKGTYIANFSGETATEETQTETATEETQTETATEEPTGTPNSTTELSSTVWIFSLLTAFLL